MSETAQSSGPNIRVRTSRIPPFSRAASTCSPAPPSAAAYTLNAEAIVGWLHLARVLCPQRDREAQLDQARKPLLAS